MQVDIYLALFYPDGSSVFGYEWDSNPDPIAMDVKLPPDFSSYDLSVFITEIPGKKPIFDSTGIYTFAIAGTEPGTWNLISNIATISFQVE